MSKNMKDLTHLYKKTHDILSEGCKSSCNVSEYGEADDYYDGKYYFFRFGGYCIGNCSRREEVRGKTEEEVINKVKDIFVKAMQENHELYTSENDKKIEEMNELTNAFAKAYEESIEISKLSREYKMYIVTRTDDGGDTYADTIVKVFDDEADAKAYINMMNNIINTFSKDDNIMRKKLLKNDPTGDRAFNDSSYSYETHEVSGSEGCYVSGEF